MAQYFERFNIAQYPNTYMGYSAAGELAVHAVCSVARTITEAVVTRRRAAQLQAAVDGIEIAVDMAVPRAIETLLVELYTD